MSTVPTRGTEFGPCASDHSTDSTLDGALRCRPRSVAYHHDPEKGLATVGRLHLGREPVEVSCNRDVGQHLQTVEKTRITTDPAHTRGLGHIRIRPARPAGAHGTSPLETKPALEAFAGRSRDFWP